MSRRMFSLKSSCATQTRSWVQIGDENVEEKEKHQRAKSPFTSIQKLLSLSLLTWCATTRLCSSLGRDDVNSGGSFSMVPFFEIVVSTSRVSAEISYAPTYREVI